MTRIFKSWEKRALIPVLHTKTSKQILLEDASKHFESVGKTKNKLQEKVSKLRAWQKCKRNNEVGQAKKLAFLGSSLASMREGKQNASKALNARLET